MAGEGLGSACSSGDNQWSDNFNSATALTDDYTVNGTINKVAGIGPDASQAIRSLSLLGGELEKVGLNGGGSRHFCVSIDSKPTHATVFGIFIAELRYNSAPVWSLYIGGGDFSSATRVTLYDGGGDYSPGGGTGMSATGVIDSGAWQNIKVRGEMSSAPGITDGWAKVFIDGVEVHSVTGWNISNMSGNPWNEFASYPQGDADNLCIALTCDSGMPVTGSLIDHSVPCCDSHAGGGSAVGPVLPPINPDWTPECVGGGTVHTAAEIVDDEDWSASGVPKDPDAWLTITTDPYPVVSPSESEVIKWGTKPLSDHDRFVEARLVEVGEIQRGSSDKDGIYPPARLRVVALDDDARLRILLAGASTRHLFHAEARFDYASYAGRKAGLDPLPQLIGRIVDVQPLVNRRAMVEIRDIVGAAFGLLNPEKRIGLEVGDEHENFPETSRGRIYNILYGEPSDNGALDAEGNTAEKGVIPVVDCGDTEFDTGSPSPVVVGPPENLTGSKVGSGSGSRTYYYGIIGITEFGHTLMSNIESVGGLPDRLDLDTYVQLNWDPPTVGADFIIAYWVLGRTSHTPNKRLDTMNNGGTYINPETSYRDGRQGSRTDFDNEKSVNYTPIATAHATSALWTWFAVAIGEVEIMAVYGSDIADGTTPKRVKLDVDAGDILTPASTGWPEADPFRVVGGIKQTGFWARGTRVHHHRDGIVTFAVNVCGYKGINGELINQAFLILQSFLNEFVEKDGGLGYLDGDFGPIETFADGTPKFWTSKFQQAQNITASWMGTALGYLGSLCICEPTSLADVLRKFFTTFGGHLTADGHGRIYPFLVDPNSSGGVLFKERRRIGRVLDHDLAWTEVENKGAYSYHFDYDVAAFRNKDNAFENVASIAAHGGDRIGVFQSVLKECPYGNDPATMATRFEKHLALYAYPPRYVRWATDLTAFQMVNGDVVRFSHRKEGLGAIGEAETPGVIMETTIAQPHEVRHRVRLLGVVEAVDDEDESDESLVSLSELGGGTLGEIIPGGG